jgi:hypothetical protein
MEARRQVCLRCVRLHVDTPSFFFFLELQVVCCHHLPLSTSPGTHLHHFAEQLPPPSLGLDCCGRLLFSSKCFFFAFPFKANNTAPAALRSPASAAASFRIFLINHKVRSPAAAYSAPLSASAAVINTPRILIGPLQFTSSIFGAVCFFWGRKFLFCPVQVDADGLFWPFRVFSRCRPFRWPSPSSSRAVNRSRCKSLRCCCRLDQNKTPVTSPSIFQFVQL